MDHVPTLIKKAELSRASASLSDRSENFLATEELKEIWINRIRNFNMLITNINLHRDSLWHESDLGTKNLDFISEKIESLLVDCLRILENKEDYLIDSGSGLSLVMSESREWFSSVLSL